MVKFVLFNTIFNKYFIQVPEGLALKLNANATRPAPWSCRLGYQSDPRPLCVPLSSLCPEGGPVGCLDVILARKYPIMVNCLFPKYGK